jgi:hypothetical protein
MPTSLERKGDFSQTTTTAGRLIPVKDPANGQQFPGNIIPASRISTAGLAMLNLFPLPSAADTSGQRQYNALYQYSLQNQREDRILRLDYNVAPRTQVFVRLIDDYQSRRGFGATHTVTSTWGQMAADWGDQSAGAVATIIHTFLPNLVNEFTAGVNRVRITSQASTPEDLAANQLGALKGPGGQPITLPKIYNANVYNLLPNIRFATLNPQSAGQGVTNPPVFAFDTMFPQILTDQVVNGQNVSRNRVTGAVYQLAQGGSFDPLSYPANGNPYSGMVQTRDIAFANPGLTVGPRVGFAWDALGNGKLALRGGFGIFYSRALNTDLSSGPISAPPDFQAPVYYNNTLVQLETALGFLSPQNVLAGPDYKNPSTYNWSFGFQRDLGRGMILEMTYIGNVVHHKFVQADTNNVAPYTTWTPAGGANPAYLDPTTGGKAFYAANLIRPIVGYGTVNTTSSSGEANYNALQTQVNRRFGKRLQFGANWTWSKTMTFTRGPWTPDSLSYASVAGSRPQVVNVNYSYRIPDGSRIWRNAATKTLLDGWRFNGITKFLSGTPLTVACTAQSAPIGYWTGTPTGGIPFRCQMTGHDPFLPAGSPLPATASRRLYYPLSAANFSLPGSTSLGIGNTPPTLFFGPGLENFDFTLLKDMRLGKESRMLEFRIEAYNVFNHFNPGNPNTSLSLNYANGANTNANFGSITASTGQPRRVALAMKFRF